jgi:hypothetical protein
MTKDGMRVGGRNKEFLERREKETESFVARDRRVFFLFSQP